jgi:GNAT superfamily N-acetyltransferase
MSIHLATTDAEITACAPVMAELRPHVGREQFLSRVRSQEREGYRLACVRAQQGVVAVAGYRIGQNLAWGRFLYVDDLVTLAEHRSKGHGAALLSWLREEAAREGCDELHLDSGIQREAAHSFYQREGLAMTSLHFVERIGAGAVRGAPPAAEPGGRGPAST